MNSPHQRPVVVLGLMGAGKTTLAVALAQAWGRPLRDSDRDLERRTGRTAARIVATDGEQALHRREADLLLEALADDPPPVIAAAASTVENALCREAMARALVVWLDVPVDELVRRQAGGTHRPVYHADLEVMLRAMDARRRPLFTQVADRRLESLGRSPAELVRAVDSALT